VELTSWIRAFFQKLVVAQLMKISDAVETHRFSTCSLEPSTGPYSIPDEPSPRSLLLRIREIPDSNLGPETDFLD
jgi:hypothetical protein